MGSKVKSVTISDKLCCTGRSLWLTVQPFPPPVVQIFLNSCCIHSGFSTKRTTSRRTPTMGGRSSSPSQDASPNIWADSQASSFSHWRQTSYRKRRQENRLDGENYSLEFYLKYSVKHCEPGEPLIFPSTSWGDFVCVLLRPLWLTSEWLCLQNTILLFL